MINIIKVDVAEHWTRASVMLADAINLSNGRHTLETTYNNLKKGVMRLYAVYFKEKLKSYFVTQITIYPAKSVYGIIFCGGKEVIRHIKKIETFFKNEAVLNGCRGLEIIGRNGWEKVIDNMPSLDFEAKGVFYEMDT
tara:strand:+ start:254 stop:667 length:414 start_codon:yes stop_codon:yes gene_type:complete